jgi:hypothetical protein
MRSTNLGASRFGSVSRGWLVFFFGLLILLCSAYLFFPSIHARYLFSELKTLQLGHSTFEDAQRLAGKINAEPYGPCDPSKCEWHKRIDNARLPRWWRGSGETFGVVFDVKDSVIVRKEAAFGTGIEDGSVHPSRVSFQEQEHWGRENTQQPVQAGWGTTEVFRYWSFTVHMTPKASAEDRRRYTAFNYSCFWKYKGCADARNLLPTADPFPFDK